MGWAHETVAMEELLGLVRGFVDVLVLAGGRTSSGAAATWRSGDVKKALQWALFFEEVWLISVDEIALGFRFASCPLRRHDSLSISGEGRVDWKFIVLNAA
jgi:hypothetical protein